MRAIRTIAPAFAPVSLAEMKAHLNVDYADDDTYIQAVLDAAIAYIDGPKATGFTLASQTWAFYFDCFPAGFRLPVWPLISITAIEYLDTEDAWQPVSALAYRAASAGYPALVCRVPGQAWPASRMIPDCVRVVAVLGHASGGTGVEAANIPADIKAAIKLTAAHWYRSREPVAEKAQFEVPLSVEAILNKYRVNLAS